MKKILYATLIIAIASCEKPVTDVKLPETKPELVVYSFISPEDSLVQVKVSLSRPIFNPTSNTPEIIPNAKVVITDNDNQVTELLYDNTLKTYKVNQNSYKIFPGKTYQITATYNNFKVIGKTTVPINFATIDSIENIIIKTNSSNMPTSRIRTTWKDLPNETNYYRVITWAINNDNTNNNFIICDFNLFKDNLSNGKDMNSVCDNYNLIEPEGIFNEIKALLLTTDKDYFEYHIRRLNYVGEDPFSEPFQMYSNVSGGIGCVCSYRLNIKTLKLKR